MDAKKLKNILEAGLLVAGRALSVAQLEALFQQDDEKPERKEIRAALEELQNDYAGRGIELVEIASGFRLQSHESVADWVANLFQEKTPRYSRALLETLVLIAYRQPITRAEIEDVRGVAVSSNIIKTLQERSWVKVLGHKEVPGRPALLGTTKDFLDYFNLKKLDELPDLADIKDLDQFDELLAEEVGEVGEQVGEQGDAANDAGTSEDGAVNGDMADDASADEGNDDGNDESVNDGSAIDDSAANDSAANDSATSGSVIHGSANSDSANSDSANEAPSNGRSSDAPDEVVNRHGNEPIADDVAAADVGSDDVGSDDERGTDDDQSNDVDDNPDHNETLSGPELDLLRVISDFSEEHQQEIDARDQMEKGIISKDGDDAADDAADLSQRLGDDNQSGDMPSPGDTLH